VAELVAIDSNIFIWGVRKDSSHEQLAMIQKTENFFDWLDAKKTRIILPAPIITEVLSPVTDKDDRKAFMDIIYQKFRIAPLDDISAEIAAEIWGKNKDFKQFYDVDGFGLKNRFKYDLMILAIAKAQKVSCLYTEDNGLRKLAIANGLNSSNIPTITPKATQSSLIDMIEELENESSSKLNESES
jgi:predicted nucleic acid-binding protein